MKTQRSTVAESAEVSAAVQTAKLTLLSELSQGLGLTAAELTLSAKAEQALVRKREIKTGFDLLRLALAYAVCEWSLRLVGVWALLLGIGHLSDVAVLKRLRRCDRWLGYLLGQLLQQRLVGATAPPGVCLRLQDATVVSKPGSRGTDYRLHLLLNGGDLSVVGAEVTDAHSGESLTHFQPETGAIRIADRGYAFAASLGPSLASGERVVVRINWQNLPLQQPTTGQRLDLPAWLAPLTTATEQPVRLATPQGCFVLRLVAAPLPPSKVADARRRLRQAARKKGHTPSAASLVAAGFVLLLTNLPSVPFDSATTLAFYALRWQIELAFKRLKSLLHLDGLRCQDPHLGQTYLLAKLLAALLCDQRLALVRQQQPTWFTTEQRPVSRWRLTAWFYEDWQRLLRGPLSCTLLFQHLPALQRYFCSAPRKRKDQAACAQTLCARFSGC